MKRRAEHEPGFVLHAYPYKETSLIVEAFTRRFGRVGLLARGARRPRSMMRGVLLAFHPLRLSWSASAELGTLMSAEWAGGQPALSGIGLMCGFYINELMLRLMPRDDPHEALFDAYGEALTRLAAGASLARPDARRGAGSGPARFRAQDARRTRVCSRARPGRGQWRRDRSGKHYAYEAERGPVETRRVDGDFVSAAGHCSTWRRTTTTTPAPATKPRRLMRALIAERLGGQALHTRAVLSELQDL